jgi:predicted GNAT family N-acyltransferase
MISILKGTYSDQDLCRTIFEIRRKVFVDEQGVSREEEFDDFEASSLHFLGLLDEIPAGTARLRITEKGIKLERFAVLPEFRNQGVAATILRETLQIATQSGVTIYLHAQESAAGLYEKFGFQKSGSPFMEAQIVHYLMTFEQKSLTSK